MKKKKQQILVILTVSIVIIAIAVIGFIMDGKKVVKAELASRIEMESMNAENIDIENIDTENREDIENSESTTNTTSISTTDISNTINSTNIDGMKFASNTTNTNLAGNNTACGINIKFLYQDKYWEKYDLTNAVYKTQDEYETAVCNYIEEIAKLLDKPDWYKQNKDKNTLYLKLVIEGKEYYQEQIQRMEEYDDTMPLSNIGGLAQYTPNSCIYVMTFNDAMFEHNIVPIVHELTDLITYNQVDKRSSFSYSLSNGLGEYVQKSLGMGVDSCDHGLDSHNYVIEYQKICEDDSTAKINIKYLNVNRIGSSDMSGFSMDSSLTLRYYWVECCSSFVDYLVQTYGIENVMKMVDGYDESIYYLLNQNGLDGLILEWQQFLNNYNCKMTWNEMNTFMAQFKSTHGY